jgi:hypothetical protein
MVETEKELKCPYCGAIMEKIDKDDVFIDRCPKCFGIWLDKGELDKIVIMKREKYTKEPKKYPPPYPGQRPPSAKFDWFYEPSVDTSNDESFE